MEIPVYTTMKQNRNRIVIFLLILQLMLICVITRKWLLVGTQRLYLEDRKDDGRQGVAWQRFVVENGSVLPQIITRNNAHTIFEINPWTRSSLRFRATPTGPAAYEIYLLRNGARQLLQKNELSGPTSGSVSLPVGRESLAIENRGAVTWSDLRVVSELHLVPYFAALAVLFLLTCSIKRSSALPTAAKQASLVAGSVLVTLLLVEFTAHLLSGVLPYSVIDSRHNLGAFRMDPRWQLSARYGKRLQPNSNSLTEREYGDLVEMAVIPADVSQATRVRYPVQTDREGFRNPFTREHIVVAALGDSFTDALQLPVEQAWPAQLERILGTPVQNYGTAGFGPQQELYVMQDYAIHHGARVVVVAYFAGNDIFDAESFARFEQSGAEAAEIPGWKIRKFVERYETLYTYTLTRIALKRMGWSDVRTARLPNLTARNALQVVAAAADPAVPPRAYFDRGMFHVPIHGHDMSFALMPAYLRTLNYSKGWLETTPGWDLTRRTYKEMKRLADQNGATLVVMFIPFKSQIYLPMLQGVFSDEDLNRNFGFYFQENKTDADVRTMTKNRLAQNEMMRGLCEEAGIPFLDLTPALQHETEQGNSVYFPDDAHWNAAGQEVTGRELAKFLRQHNLDFR